MDALAEALETTVADLVAGPLTERKEQGPAPDPFASSTERGERSEGYRALEARIDGLQKTVHELAAQQTKLLAELAAERKARQDAQQSRTQTA